MQQIAESRTGDLNVELEHKTLGWSHRATLNSMHMSTHAKITEVVSLSTLETKPIEIADNRCCFLSHRRVTPTLETDFASCTGHQPSN